VSVVLLGSSVSWTGWVYWSSCPPYRPLFIKVDYRWILPYAAVLGAILLLVADIGGRLLIAPQETPWVYDSNSWRPLHLPGSVKSEKMNKGWLVIRFRHSECLAALIGVYQQYY